MRYLLTAVLTMFAASAAHADTYTSNMGLTEPTIGSTGWGGKINGNMVIIDTTVAAIAVTTGTLSATQAQLGISTYTLSNSTANLAAVKASSGINNDITELKALRTIDPALTLLSSGTANFGLGVSTINLGQFIDYAAQASVPASPAAGVTRAFSSTNNGITRIQLDNELASNLVVTQDSTLIVRNMSGGNMSKGSPAYITGATGNVPNVSPAIANSTFTIPAVGLLLNDIASNGYGLAMTKGVLTSTTTSSFNSGDTLYVSTSQAGGLTNVRPPVPYYRQRVGYVLTSGVGNGSIAVEVGPWFDGHQPGSTWPQTFTDPGFTIGGSTFVVGGGSVAFLEGYTCSSGSCAKDQPIQALSYPFQVGSGAHPMFWVDSSGNVMGYNNIGSYWGHGVFQNLNVGVWGGNDNAAIQSHGSGAIINLNGSTSDSTNIVTDTGTAVSPAYWVNAMVSGAGALSHEWFVNNVAAMSISTQGAVGFMSQTMAQLRLIATPSAGFQMYCSDCSPKKMVISTGTSAGNWADTTGGTFK